MTQADVAAPDAALLAFPDTPERRLRRALRQLDAALEEQRMAVAAFRGEVQALNGALAGLGVSADRLRGALGDAAGEAERARAASRALLATADALEAAARR
jgi:hypothetical protein